ncbi:MAG: IclR family transcriptional regulator [Robiginitomaculum sp.]|nr:MAG: IclR family transcriptional regulator [Robiginitomaculum sp.]
MVTEKKYSAPALEKGLDILELLSEQEFGLSQVDIARELKRSVSEIFRMIVVLQDRGYVMLEPGGDKYMLTTFLFEVAHRTPLVKRLTALAGPSMRRLTAEINQSAHLAILSGDHILVVGQVDSPGNNIMSVRLGAKIEIWRASSGRVILAHQPVENLAEIIEKVPLPDDMSLAIVREELSKIREIGHEVMDSYVVGGVVNISAPIIDHSGHAIAALTVPHIKRLNEIRSFAECVDKLLQVTKSLSASLGGGAAKS